jgi:hypothetical protein
MLFMIIERFKDNDMVPIYRQVRDGSRLLPDGLKYIDSWVEPNFSRCFQLMECDDLRLFQQWVLEWRGYGATIEIIPVVSSADTQAVVAPFLDRP